MITTYGIALTEGLDIPTVASRVDVSSTAMLRQRLRIRLLTQRGEWLPDRRIGVPYIEWMQAKPPPVAQMVSYIRQVIADTPGVVSVELSGSFSASSRAVTLTGIVIAEAEVLPITYTAPTDGGVPRLEWIAGAFAGGC